jgi:hypothetical protein
MHGEWGRRGACWAVDHALPMAGLTLLAAGQLWGGWLTPPGWAAVGLAAFAWLAESNGYAMTVSSRGPLDVGRATSARV